MTVGRVVGPVTVGPVAHGGHCVARLDGRVVFVRHALPDEDVMVRITDTSHPSYWRGDAVEVLRPSAMRISPACPVSGPGGCGGCDFQHVAPDHQRELKRRVVAEQLHRMAGLDWSGDVEAVEPVDRWRTRMRWLSDDHGRWGMRRHHGHTVVALPESGCAISLVGTPPAPAAAPGTTAEVVRAGDQVTTLVDGRRTAGPERVGHEVAGRRYEMAATGFWQIHPRAAATLVDAVSVGLDPQPGERALDLYCGVGLFAGSLVNKGISVWGVEYDREAVRSARRNVPEARFSVGDVARVLRDLPARTDLVVLDPPRKGAGRKVMEQVLAREPRRIAYVACDPAALARDLRTALDAGWAVESLRAFDLFPMTHHVEAVAIMSR